MNTVEENKRWGEYNWRKDGDEWNDQADFCNQPYDKWKNSIVEHFIYKNINKDFTVLEIAPGHGRWSEFILNKCNKLILVDLNPKCIDFCKKKFFNFKNIEYYVNDGKKLNFIKDDSIDFIFSYDSFVHMEKDVIESYFNEFSRILKIGGTAIIHHAGRNNIALKLNFLNNFGKIGKFIYKLISLNIFFRLHEWRSNFSKEMIRNIVFRSDGWRSDVSKEMIRNIATQNGLTIKYQIDSWGKNGEYNTKLFKDYISKIVKN